MKNKDKKILLFVIATIVTSLGIGYTLLKGTSALEEVPANPAFDDINFYKCVVDAYNRENKTSLGYDTCLSDNQLSTITYLVCDNIASANGVEKLTNLDHLRLLNGELTELNISSNKLLSNLNIQNNQIESIDLSKNENLQYLDVSKNKLTNLDVSKNTSLNKLSAAYNQIAKLDISNNNQLTYLWVSSNQLSYLDVSKNTLLTELYVNDNYLNKLDLSKNTALKYLLIENNSFGDTYYVYEGNDISVEEKIVFPNSLTDVSSMWESNNLSVVPVVSSSGVVSTISSGIANITRTHTKDSLVYSHTINVVEINSNKYKIDDNDNYIFIGTESDVEVIESNISKSNEMVVIDIDLDNNKLYVKSGDAILKDFDIIRIKFGDFYVFDKVISLTGKVTYNDFINDITMSDGITYKIYSDTEEVISGNISEGMKVKIYYNDEELCEYLISNEYVKFKENLSLDKSSMIIGNILVDTTIDSVKNMIDTNGSIDFFDKNDNVLDTTSKLKTGDGFKIKLTNQTLIYKISVNGDVNGDGIMNRDDIELSSKHIIKGNLIKGAEYLKSVDVDSNNKININDIIKMIRQVKVSD